MDSQRTIYPKRMNDVTDWNGTLLRKGIFKLLCSGCIVRVLCDFHPEKGNRQPCTEINRKYSGSCSYYRVTKIKDGSIWGTVLDTYKTCECSNCREKMPGQVMTFRFNQISEIPISWQPKSVKKKMRQFRTSKGYLVTGWR